MTGKTYEKSISFYNIILNTTTLDYYNNREDSSSNFVRRILKNVFANGEDLYSVDNTINVDIKQMTDNFIFGTVCKADKLDTVLSQIRKSDKSIRELELSADERFEKYTYFYIDINKLKISYLNNKSIPHLNNILIQLIEKVFQGIEITPIIVNNLIDRLENNSEITKIEYSTLDDDTTKKLLKDSYDPELGISSIGMCIRFSKANLKKSVQFFNNIYTNKRKFNSLKVTYLNTTNGYTEIVDAMTNYIKLKSMITLSDNNLKNDQIIQKHLKEELDKMMFNKMI